ncbi:MAG: S1C family serine protease, partial [Candidatus Nitrosopolaris sp.]
MGKRTEIVLLAMVLSLAVTIIMQGSIFDSTKAIRHSLTNIATAITYLQKSGTNGDSPATQISSETNQTQLQNIALLSSSRTANLTTIFKQVENSVVQITAKTSNPNLQIIINGNQLGGQSTRLGSGFVYDKQGHILTNNHVIDGASTADVTFVDGNTYRAKVIGKDSSSDI